MTKSEEKTAENDNKEQTEKVASTEKILESDKMVKPKTFKKVLLTVHSLVLILSVFLFVSGLYTNLKHFAYHEAWHSSYGIFNASVMCIIIGLIGLIISITGELFLTN